MKATNDTYGHAIGDQMILSMAENIRAHMRQEDMLCRWGGDEFLLLMNCNTDKADVIMHAIQSDLHKSNEENKEALPFQLAFSYGIIEFDANKTIDKLITIADHKMYENKKAKYARR